MKISNEKCSLYTGLLSQFVEFSATLWFYPRICGKGASLPITTFKLIAADGKTNVSSFSKRTETPSTQTSRRTPRDAGLTFRALCHHLATLLANRQQLRLGSMFEWMFQRKCEGIDIVQSDHAPEAGVAQGIFHGDLIRHQDGHQEELEEELEEEVERRVRRDHSSNQTQVRMHG